MMRKILAIVFGLGLIWLVAFLLSSGMKVIETNGLVRVANNFMTELQNGNEANAYSYYSVGLQQNMDAETFATAFNSVTIESWEFTERSVEDTRGQVSGTIIMDGQPVSTTIWFTNITGTWKIISFDLSPQ